MTLAWMKDSHLGICHVGSKVVKVHPTGGLSLKFIHSSSRHQTPHSLAFPGPSIVRNTDIKGWTLCPLRSVTCRNWAAASQRTQSHGTMASFCSFQCKFCGKPCPVGQALGKADLGSPDLLLGKAGWLGIPGAILLSCAMCITMDPLSTCVALH